MKKSVKKLILATTVCACALTMATGLSIRAENTTAETEIGGVSVDLSNFATYYGASVRTNKDDPGMRFTTGLPQSEYEELVAIDGISFGTIAVPADLFDAETELTHATAAASGITPWEVTATSFITDADDVLKAGNVDFTGVITEIRDYNINRAYRSRAYIKYQPDGAETPTYYYAKYYTEKTNTTLSDNFNNARSIAGVSYSAKHSDDDYTTDQHGVFDYFIGFRPNAVTENFERVISDVRAYGVYAKEGTTATVSKTGALNGSQSLVLTAGSGEAVIDVRMPVFDNLIAGSSLTFKSSAQVSVSMLDGTPLTVTQTQADEWYNVVLSADDTATVKSVGITVTAANETVLDDFAVSFAAPKVDGKTTFGDILDTQFGDLTYTVEAMSQVFVNTSAAVYEETVMQKGGAYSATVKVSANGYNDGTFTGNYQVDASYQKGYDAYIDKIAPNATIQNDGATVTVDSTATKPTRTAKTIQDGLLLENDEQNGEVLKIVIDKNGNAVVFNYNALDVSNYDSLRLRIKASDSMSLDLWYNAYISVNGAKVGTLIGQLKSMDWVEVVVSKSAYQSALVDGKYVNTIALYSESGGQVSSFYLDYLQFVNEHTMDFSQITQLPYGIEDATLADYNGTQALKITTTGLPKIAYSGITIEEGQKVVMEVLSLQNNDGGTSTKVAVNANSSWAFDITSFTTNYQLLNKNLTAGTLSYFQLVGNSTKNYTMYIKSICIVDEVVPSFATTAGTTTTLDFSAYPLGTVFTGMMGSVRELNGEKMLCVPMDNTNTSRLFYTFATGENLLATDTITISIAATTNGFNVGTSTSSSNNIGWAGGAKDITKTGVAISSIYFKQYPPMNYGYIWIKSITVTRGA
ncbi:MAG: hypothetical protein IJA89_04470 [Clostridia bacterium]|nr:hypothetical protein [Clostridia bacterium]